MSYALRVRRNTLGRLLTLFLLSLPAFLGCSGLLGVDDYEKSSDALCGLLDRCYSDPLEGCRSHVDVSLDQADAGARALWLAQFSDLACLNQCSNARRCLDLSPLCQGNAEDCIQKEDCCGFVKGKADCKDGKCCGSKGVKCDTNDDCCDQDCAKGYCGGVACLELEAPCTNNSECCSGVCNDQFICAEICADDGFPCGADGDCCNKYCDNGICMGQGCTPLGAACDNIQPCCSDGSLDVQCLPSGTKSYCTPTSCLTLDVPCAPGSQIACCDGLVCDPTRHTCGIQCGNAGSQCDKDGQCCSKTCKPDGTCDCHDGACTTDDECCSGKCIGFACAPSCKPVDTGHDACSVGGPLDVNNDPCAAAVCASDEFCCCLGWDELCVASALKETSLCACQ